MRGGQGSCAPPALPSISFSNKFGEQEAESHLLPVCYIEPSLNGLASGRW
jgi:hypothetical protein